MSGLGLWGEGRSPRRSLSKGDKLLILRSQGGKCARCGKTLRYVDAHFDHKKPRAAGGSDRISNYQAVHPTCHWRKTKQDIKKIARAKRAKTRRDPFDLGLRVPSMRDIGF